MAYGKDDVTVKELIAQRRDVLRVLSEAATFAPATKERYESQLKMLDNP